MVPAAAAVVLPRWWRIQFKGTPPIWKMFNHAGVDEVGRGCLFGPVVAAAVVLPVGGDEKLLEIGVTDSKLLTPFRREVLARQIKVIATNYQIGVASTVEIDRLNILRASLLAMQRAVIKLQPIPTCCLVDGNQPIPGLSMEQKTWVKGDRESVIIAAASIIAKVWRDDLMVRMDRRYPGYDLASNKGYGTQNHRDALQKLGSTPQHRSSFNFKSEQAIATVASTKVSVED